MKCHEFMSAAELLTTSQLPLMQTEHPVMSVHTRECPACADWFASQWSLSSALQTLHMDTLERQASPALENTLLQVFRAYDFHPSVSAAPEHAAPAAWKLSRVFELAAYAAVAAAVIVGAFLGLRVLNDRNVSPTQVQAGKGTPVPVSDEARTVVAKSSVETPRPENSNLTGYSASSSNSAVRRKHAQSVTEPSEKIVDTNGFVSLMLCDPLICSGDEQIIRMELPGTNASGPVLADVVVGEDGLVRAMRIVN
jgi:negative regulator of sigma E activity